MTTAPEHLDESTAREKARRRVERKRKLRNDFVAYIVINCFLIGVWAFTGLGYFWPGWVLGGWGVLLMLDAWKTYNQGPVTDHEIEQEMRRGQ